MDAAVLVPYDEAPARGHVFRKLSKKWTRAANKYTDRKRRSRTMIEAIKTALNDSHPARAISDIIMEVDNKVGYGLTGASYIFFYRMFYEIARGQARRKRRRFSKRMLFIGADDRLTPALEMRYMFANDEWLYKHCLLDTALTRRHAAKRQRYADARALRDSSSGGEP